MFEARFKKEGILSPEVGRDYRRCILEPGSTIDAADMLRNFLGREPSREAFLRSKGLSQSSIRARRRLTADHRPSINGHQLTTDGRHLPPNADCRHPSRAGPQQFTRR
ncbi:Neurolysin, mitochondrial [Amphibalanus amphitrite]|uniref:Neurolysin, mitochondrial n=1 Tax=Amphibalanus amphitrite TaxID=1232801 RepID=A0A6A4W772_AMPAM|nr:Neurolysin, mitochondrial [Amphibalanus amphitrite]